MERGRAPFLIRYKISEHFHHFVGYYVFNSAGILLCEFFSCACLHENLCERAVPFADTLRLHCACLSFNKFRG